MFEPQGVTEITTSNNEIQDLDAFLASVEKRAFRMAVLATGNKEDALDIVQDTMMKLVGKYRHKSSSEWSPLFYRILQSTLNDWHRRKNVRQRWLGFIHLPGGSSSDDNESAGADPIAQAPDPAELSITANLDNERAMLDLEKHLAALPMRQQQVFLLRVWEGLNVADTAMAMGCSQGSVKTHYSRAIHSLRNSMERFL